jgi:hypothetical protein
MQRRPFRDGRQLMEERRQRLIACVVPRLHRSARRIARMSEAPRRLGSGETSQLRRQRLVVSCLLVHAIGAASIDAPHVEER